jgi:hypothetical protein
VERGFVVGDGRRTHVENSSTCCWVVLALISRSSSQCRPMQDRRHDGSDQIPGLRLHFMHMQPGRGSSSSLR